MTKPTDADWARLHAQGLTVTEATRRLLGHENPYSARRWASLNGKAWPEAQRGRHRIIHKGGAEGTRSTPKNPEQALWLAVLHEMWNCVFHPTTTMDGYRDQQEAKRWFESRYFNQVCDLALINPEWARRKYLEKLSMAPDLRPIAIHPAQQKL